MQFLGMVKQRHLIKIFVIRQSFTVSHKKIIHTVSYPLSGSSSGLLLWIYWSLKSFTKSTRSEMLKKGQKVMVALLKPFNSTTKPQIDEPIKHPR